MNQKQIIDKIAQLEIELNNLKAQLPKTKTVDVPSAFEPIFDQAEETVSNYFKDLKFNPENGSIEINNERYVLIRAASLSDQFFTNFQSNFVTKSKDESFEITKEFLFDFGHTIGIEDAKRFQEKLNLKDPISKLSAGPVHFAYTGWASVKIDPISNPSPNSSFFLKYEHPYSFEADSWIKNNKTSTKPVCIMNAAYSSGWCEESFGIKLTAVEVSCRAKGDKNCSFIMAPPEKIHEYLEEENKKSSVDLNQLIPSFFERNLINEKIQTSERLLNEAQHMAKLGFWEFNLQTQELFWSDELKDIFEFHDIPSNELYSNYLNALSENDKKKLDGLINDAVQHKKEYHIEHIIYVKNKKTKWINSNGIPVVNEKGEVVKLKGIAQEITDKIKSERDLKSFFENSIDLLSIANTSGYLLKTSPSWTKCLGYSEKELTDNPFIHFVHPDDIDKTIQEASKIAKGNNSISFENRYKTKSGEYRHLSWNAFYDSISKLVYCTTRDITDQKESEKKLLKNEKMLATAQRIAKIGSWEFDLIKNQLTWSKELYHIFDLDEGLVTNLFESYYSAINEEDTKRLQNCFEKCVSEGISYSLEHGIKTKKGKVKTLSCLGIPEYDIDGKVIKVYGIAQDVTQEKQQKEVLLNNIKEKEILLKEVHHRVKNNLQIISSLINLQSSLTENTEVLNLFRESQNRVKSIATVHELLYQSNDLSLISFDDYLKKLVNDLIITYLGYDPTIDLTLESEVKFSIDTAIPLGLLINEIISNSLKHGLKDIENKAIYIKLKIREDSKFILYIGDNGIGYEGFEDDSQFTSLGIMLIKELSNQINGEIVKLNDKKGTHYKLEFEAI